MDKFKTIVMDSVRNDVSDEFECDYELHRCEFNNDNSETDEFDDNDTITLQTADGEDVEFIEVAGIAYLNNFYAILQPVDLLDGMGEDEALVFKVSKNKDGSDKFEIELDDSIIDAVFAEYNRLLDEAE